MITAAPRQALFIALFMVAGAQALPKQDARPNAVSPISWGNQALSSSVETDVSVQDSQRPSAPSLNDEDFHPYLDVDDLSAEYEYDYRSYESDESDEDDDDDARVRRSLMGRGSAAGGGRRGGGRGGVERRRGGDGNPHDYGGGMGRSHYNYNRKSGPIPAPDMIAKTNSAPSPAVDTSSTKAKKEKKKKKKSGPKKNKDRNGLSKSLRQEIAEYAYNHGLVAANEEYKSKVGRILPEKVIDKWVQRLRKKLEKQSS